MIVFPQINANKRKCFLGVFAEGSGVHQLLCVSRVTFTKNNINYSRSFAENK